MGFSHVTGRLRRACGSRLETRSALDYFPAWVGERTGKRNVGGQPHLIWADTVHVTLTKEVFERDKFVRHRLGYATFLSLAHKYIYVETPKNACSSTKLFLFEIEGLTPPKSVGQVHERRRGDGRPSLRDLGFLGTSAILDDPDFIKFCVFRDPTRRLFSAFRNKICDPSIESYDEVRKSLLNAFSLSDFKEVRFAHFAEWVCNQPDELRDHHYMSQWALNLCDYVDFDFVVRMDHYAQDMQLLAKRLGLAPDSIPDFGRRTNVSHSGKTTIPKGVINQVSAAYEKDFDILKMHKGGYD